MSHKNCPKRLKNRIFSLIIFTFVLTFLFLFLLSDTIYAQTSDQISLQGKIVRNDTGYEGLNVVEGTPTCVASGADTCDFQVKYYSASTSGTLYLTETFSDIEIGDYGGVFNLKLGSGSATTTAECSDGTCNTIEEVFGEFKTIYLEIGFAPGGAGSFTEIFTRTSLNASAFAMGAGSDSFSFYNTDNTGESSLNAVAGAVYYNTTDDELKLYNGSSWVSLATGSSSLWTEQDVGVDYSTYMSASGLGTFDDFTLDLDDDRLSVHTAQMKGGFSVYSSYDLTGGTWPLVSFKADHSNYAGSILELTQDGTGDILTGYTGSTLSFQVDNSGNIHLASNGVGYWEPFSSDPTSGDLSPNTGEGCMYSYGGHVYWDSACDSSAEVQMDGGSSLWTDGGTFTYLSSTTDDLVLGASTAASSKFFFDVSEGRLGIGTDSPQAAIDIAGTNSTISNSSGDITITPADQLVILGDVELGNGSTTRSLYAYNAARTYYGQIELYNLVTGNMTLRSTFDTGDIVLNPGGDVIIDGGDINLSTVGSRMYGEDLEISGDNSSDIYLQPDGGNVGVGTVSPIYSLDIKARSSVNSAVFTGTGLNDMTSGGTFIGSSALNYKVEIDAAGIPDTFKWSDDGGTTWDATGVAITGLAQTLNNGVTVTFGATTGHTLGDYWTFSTTVTNPLAVQNAAGTRSLYVGNDGNVGIGTDSPSGLLTLAGDFYVTTNNSYDIGSTSTRWRDVYTQGQIDIGADGDNGNIRYNTTDNRLEYSNDDGSTWVVLEDVEKSVVLSAEYAGAILAADGSSNTGSMTSDAEGSASDSMNYYEWNSSEATLQDYDVRIRFTLPDDFITWIPTGNIKLNYATEAASSTNNKVDMYVYEESSGTVDASVTNQYSSSAGVWESATISGYDFSDCNESGETCVIILRMYSASDNYVRIGDIEINYQQGTYTPA
jgi:hypothetical protein